VRDTVGDNHGVGCLDVVPGLLDRTALNSLMTLETKLPLRKYVRLGLDVAFEESSDTAIDEHDSDDKESDYGVDHDLEGQVVILYLRSAQTPPGVQFHLSIRVD
jgi:hypothetical protein